MKKMLLAFIPTHISNRVVLWFFELFGKISHIGRRKLEEHFKINEERFEKYLKEAEDSEGYLEHQHGYSDILFGKKTVSYSGCEVIAVYNALISLGAACRYSFSKLIYEFEKKGIALNGRFGTSPRAMEEFFKKEGYVVESHTNLSGIKELEEAYDTFILTIYNDKTNINKYVHSINISKKDGMFLVHNLKGNGKPPLKYAGITDFIRLANDGKIREINIIGIKCKKV